MWMKILNFGSLNIDHVYEVSHFLHPGETLSSSQYQCFPGGKGLNQSIAMAKAGSYVYHAGKVGPNSEVLIKVLQESGVDTTFLDTSGSVTGHAIIQVNHNGENCILLYGGSNLEITTDYVDWVFAQLKDDCILLLQNEINNMEYILGKAKGRGMRVALNPSPIDEKLKNTDLTGVTWLILNEIEGEQLSGSNQPEEMIQRLIKCYPSMRIILTLGNKGSIYQDAVFRYNQKVYPAEVKDTTAAGDTFTGYFLSEIVSGGDLRKALDLAAKAAAITVTRDGASSSIPSKEEVMKQHTIL
jgi:ribokinase